APNAVAKALRYLAAQGATNAVIEGTTALEWIAPRAAVMVATDPGKSWKSVAREHILTCDIVLHNRVPTPPGDLKPPPEFRQANPVSCDLSLPDEPGTRCYRERLRQLCGASGPGRRAASG
ncbi:MAG: hypothetical protein M3Z37_04965, partial [Candidatus Eremiobacteraeota bacterium]|nr:hypothetical protein [Candidatus Eremiobacteraeota bacterium]